MTTEQITKLEAGREMDRAVFEKVFRMDPANARIGLHADGDIEYYLGYPAGHDIAPHFSTDIGAAWRVVEKLRETYSRVEVHSVTVLGEDARYVCMVEEKTGEVHERYVAQADAATAPLAIVRAALMAVERTEK